MHVSTNILFKYFQDQDLACKYLKLVLFSRIVLFALVSNLLKDTSFFFFNQGNL